MSKNVAGEALGERRRERWFFGGIGAAVADLFTHPIDTYKVLIQTQKTHIPAWDIIKSMIQFNGRNIC